MRRVLFISRAFPPTIGGIEKQNFHISEALSQKLQLTRIVNTRGKKYLPFFMVYALIKSLASRRSYEVILLGDGVLGVLGYLLKRMTGIPVVCVLHGLDITYKNKLYQKFWLGRFLPELDKYIAVGNETVSQGVQRGLDPNKFEFIPNGVDTNAEIVAVNREELNACLGRQVEGTLLLTLGRLVKRKGVTWFVDSVIPHLKNNFTYVIAGEGIERESIKSAIRDNELADKVIFLGAVSDNQKRLLMTAADIFVQPNIKVDGDMEGFGLVVLEAAHYRTLVVASELEGLKDAIQEGKNGLLVEHENSAAFINTLQPLMENSSFCNYFGNAAHKYVKAKFSWQIIADKYTAILNQVSESKRFN